MKKTLYWIIGILAAYDLDDVIANDIDENAELLGYVVKRIGKGLPLKIKSSQVADEDGETQTFNCTSFQSAKADGEGFWFGRNYDYFKNPTLVTVSRPRHLNSPQSEFCGLFCFNWTTFGQQ